MSSTISSVRIVYVYVCIDHMMRGSAEYVQYTLLLSMKWGAKDMVHEQKQPANTDILWTWKQKCACRINRDRLVEQKQKNDRKANRTRERGRENGKEVRIKMPMGMGCGQMKSKTKNNWREKRKKKSKITAKKVKSWVGTLVLRCICSNYERSRACFHLLRVSIRFLYKTQTHTHTHTYFFFFSHLAHLRNI